MFKYRENNVCLRVAAAFCGSGRVSLLFVFLYVVVLVHRKKCNPTKTIGSGESNRLSGGGGLEIFPLCARSGRPRGFVD